MNNKICFYLDKNAIQYIFKPRVDYKDDKVFGTTIQLLINQIDIPFSTAHFRDLFKNWDKNEETKKYTYEDLNNIQKLTNGLYVYFDDENTYFYPNADVIKSFELFVENQKASWNKINQ